MAMVMVSILSSPVNTTHAFPDWSFQGWILSTKFYISFPLGYKQKNHSFFFPLSFFRKDEDYVIINLKKNLYLSFSHKYILKIIHFFFSCFSLFFKDLIMCLVQIKKSINLQFFLLWQKIKPKFFFPTTQENTIHKNHNTKMLKQLI